jgi:hypothetical protein
LEFAHWRADDQGELANVEAMAQRLGQAQANLGVVADSRPGLPLPPVAGAVEVFSSVWMLPDGSGLALRQPDGVIFLDGRGWYRDQARQQPLAEPTGFRSVALNYLGARVRDRDATAARLDGDIRLLETVGAL